MRRASAKKSEICMSFSETQVYPPDCEWCFAKPLRTPDARFRKPKKRLFRNSTAARGHSSGDAAELRSRSGTRKKGDRHRAQSRLRQLPHASSRRSDRLANERYDTVLWQLRPLPLPATA